MNNMEYAEILDYVNGKSTGLENVNLYKVHSSYDPKTNEINKVTLKINYTKDGSSLPEINGRMPKSIAKRVVQRSVQFRGENCNKDEVKNWIDNFMEEKGREYHDN